MRIFIVLMFCVYSFTFADDVFLLNGFVFRNVQVVGKDEKMLHLQGQDILFSVLSDLVYRRDILGYNSKYKSSYELVSKKMSDDFNADHISRSLNNISITMRNGVLVQGEYYSSTDTTATFLTNYGSITINKVAISHTLPAEYESVKSYNSSKNLTKVTLLNGESFQGEFLSSTDTTATYQTNLGMVTVNKNLIATTQAISSTQTLQVTKPYSERSTKRVTIKEYNNLPLLIITIAGGAWAVSLFSDAKDYSDAADAFDLLGLKQLADEANDKYNTKLLTGIGVSIVAVIFLAWAVTPTEKYIEQPISIIPTSDGMRVAIHF